MENLKLFEYGLRNNQYPNDTKLCDVDPEIYQKIVHAFQEIVDRAEFTDNDSESAAETSAWEHD